MLPEREKANASVSGLEGVIKESLPILAEIRKRCWLVFLVFLVSAFLGAVFYEEIVTFSLKIFRFEGVNIAFTSPFQFLDLAVSCALAVGVIATLPVIMFQVLSFLKPALREKEFRFIMTLIPVAVLLFIAGFFYGVIVMKYVIGLFYQQSLKLNIGNLLDVSSLLSQIIVTSALIGAAFEFPLVLTAGMKLGVVSYHTVASQRPVIWFICLLFASLLPPTDPLSLALLTLPLVFLFESTLVLNRVLLKTHRL